VKIAGDGSSARCWVMVVRVGREGVGLHALERETLSSENKYEGHSDDTQLWLVLIVVQRPRRGNNQRERQERWL
jgi:hypothetical protein